MRQRTAQLLFWLPLIALALAACNLSSQAGSPPQPPVRIDDVIPIEDDDIEDDDDTDDSIIVEPIETEATEEVSTDSSISVGNTQPDDADSDATSGGVTQNNSVNTSNPNDSTLDIPVNVNGGSTSSGSSGGTSASSGVSAGSGVDPNYFWVELPAPYPSCSVHASGDYTVNIRSGPGTQHPVLGILGKAAWVKVSQYSNGWYKIDYPNTPVHGAWISNDPVSLTGPCNCYSGYCQPQNPAPAPNPYPYPNPYPQPNPQPNYYWVKSPPPYPACSVHTKGAYTLYIREWAHDNAPIIGVLDKTAWVKVSQYTNGWYKVDYPNTPVHGKWLFANAVDLTQPCSCASGYCQPQYPPPPPPPPPTPSYYVVHQGGYPAVCSVINYSGTPVNIRQGYGSGFPIVGKLAYGSWIKVQSLVSGWYKVSYPGTPVDSYWIYSGVVQLHGPCTCDQYTCNPIPATPIPTPIPTLTPTPYVPLPYDDACNVTPTVNVPVYDAPDGTGSAVGELGSGVTVSAQVRSVGGWYRITYSTAATGYSWVAPDNLSLSGDCAGLPVA